MNLLAEYVELTPKIYSYWIDDGNSDKIAKVTKKCIIKRRLKFEDYKEILIKQQNHIKITTTV